MGLFFNYNKPGPGVDKEAQKEGLALVLQTIKLKIMPMIQLNCLYLIISLPMTAVLWLLSGILSNQMLDSQSTQNIIAAFATDNGTLNNDLYMQWIMILDIFIRMFFTTIIMMLWGSGPASTAMNAVLNRYMTGTPSWLWSDFKDEFKKNFKQGMVVSVIDVIVYAVLLVAFIVYGKLEALSFMRYMLIPIFIIYSMMHFYIYPMMLKYTLTLKELYRNSLILSIGKIIPSIFIFIASIMICIIPVVCIYFASRITICIAAILMLLFLLYFFSLMWLIRGANARVQMAALFRQNTSGKLSDTKTS